MNDKFGQLESKNVVIKQANSFLSKRLVDTERQCWANAQYAKRECIEVVGIPKIFFQKIGCELSPRDLEACHRLRKNSDRVMVKFSSRKDCEQIMSVKKDLKKGKNARHWVNRQSIYIYKYKLMPLLPNVVVRMKEAS